MQGFEIYMLRDHKRAHKLLERFPGSIMFINIDERLTEPEWEAYIREIQENPLVKTRLGILSYNTDQALMQKYLMEMMVPCGYVQLKQGTKESALIIRDALLANEAKGRRKSFRAVCEEGSGIMTFKGDSWSIHGKILDISSAGFAAKMDRAQKLDNNTLLRKVQLKLRGAQAMVDLIYLGPRYDDPNIWILLFDPTSVTDNAKSAINHFIKLCLQRLIDTVEV
jgi:hypothetical protein